MESDSVDSEKHVGGANTSPTSQAMAAPEIDVPLSFNGGSMLPDENFLLGEFNLPEFILEQNFEEENMGGSDVSPPHSPQSSATLNSQPQPNIDPPPIQANNPPMPPPNAQPPPPGFALPGFLNAFYNDFMQLNPQVYIGFVPPTPPGGAPPNAGGPPNVNPDEGTWIGPLPFDNHTPEFLEQRLITKSNFLGADPLRGQLQSWLQMMHRTQGWKRPDSCITEIMEPTRDAKMIIANDEQTSDIDLIWQFWHKRKDVLMCDKGHVMDGPKMLPHSKWHCVNSEMFGSGCIRLEDWNREREFLIDKDLPQYECYSCETCKMYLCDKCAEDKRYHEVGPEDFPIGSKVRVIGVEDPRWSHINGADGVVVDFQRKNDRRLVQLFTDNSVAVALHQIEYVSNDYVEARRKLSKVFRELNPIARRLVIVTSAILDFVGMFDDDVLASEGRKRSPCSKTCPLHKRRVSETRTPTGLLFQSWMVPDFQLVPIEFLIGDSFEEVRLGCIHPLLENEFEQSIVIDLLRRILPEMQSVLKKRYSTKSLLNRRIQIVLKCNMYNFDEEPLRLPRAQVDGHDVDQYLLSAGYCVSSVPTKFDTIKLFDTNRNPLFNHQFFQLCGLKTEKYNGHTVRLRGPSTPPGRMTVEVMGSTNYLQSRDLRQKIKVKPINLARSARVIFEGIERKKEKYIYTQHEPEHFELYDDQFWVLDNRVCSQKIETKGRTGSRMILFISLVDPDCLVDSCNPLFLRQVLKPIFRVPFLVELIGTYLGCAPIKEELRRKWANIVRYKRNSGGIEIDSGGYGCRTM